MFIELLKESFFGRKSASKEDVKNKVEALKSNEYLQKIIEDDDFKSYYEAMIKNVESSLKEKNVYMAMAAVQRFTNIISYNLKPLDKHTNIDFSKKYKGVKNTLVNMSTEADRIIEKVRDLQKSFLGLDASKKENESKLNFVIKDIISYRSKYQGIAKNYNSKITQHYNRSFPEIEDLSDITSGYAAEEYGIPTKNGNKNESKIKEMAQNAKVYVLDDILNVRTKGSQKESFVLVLFDDGSDVFLKRRPGSTDEGTSIEEVAVDIYNANKPESYIGTDIINSNSGLEQPLVLMAASLAIANSGTDSSRVIDLSAMGMVDKIKNASPMISQLSKNNPPRANKLAIKYNMPSPMAFKNMSEIFSIKNTVTNEDGTVYVVKKGTDTPDFLVLKDGSTIAYNPDDRSFSGLKDLRTHNVYGSLSLGDLKGDGNGSKAFSSSELYAIVGSLILNEPEIKEKEIDISKANEYITKNDDSMAWVLGAIKNNPALSKGIQSSINPNSDVGNTIDKIKSKEELLSGLKFAYGDDSSSFKKSQKMVEDAYSNTKEYSDFIDVLRSGAARSDDKILRTCINKITGWSEKGSGSGKSLSNSASDSYHTWQSGLSMVSKAKDPRYEKISADVTKQLFEDIKSNLRYLWKNGSKKDQRVEGGYNEDLKLLDQLLLKVGDADLEGMEFSLINSLRGLKGSTFLSKAINISIETLNILDQPKQVTGEQDNLGVSVEDINSYISNVYTIIQGILIDLDDLKSSGFEIPNPITLAKNNNVDINTFKQSFTSIITKGEGSDMFKTWPIGIGYTTQVSKVIGNKKYLDLIDSRMSSKGMTAEDWKKSMNLSKVLHQFVKYNAENLDNVSKYLSKFGQVIVDTINGDHSYSKGSTKNYIHLPKEILSSSAPGSFDRGRYDFYRSVAYQNGQVSELNEDGKIENDLDPTDQEIEVRCPTCLGTKNVYFEKASKEECGTCVDDSGTPTGKISFLTNETPVIKEFGENLGLRADFVEKVKKQNKSVKQFLTDSKNDGTIITSPFLVSPNDSYKESSYNYKTPSFKGIEDDVERLSRLFIGVFGKEKYEKLEDLVQETPQDRLPIKESALASKAYAMVNSLYKKGKPIDPKVFFKSSSWGMGTSSKVVDLAQKSYERYSYEFAFSNPEKAFDMRWTEGTNVTPEKVVVNKLLNLYYRYLRKSGDLSNKQIHDIIEGEKHNVDNLVEVLHKLGIEMPDEVFSYFTGSAKRLTAIQEANALRMKQRFSNNLPSFAKDKSGGLSKEAKVSYDPINDEVMISMLQSTQESIRQKAISVLKDIESGDKDLEDVEGRYGTSDYAKNVCLQLLSTWDGNSSSMNPNDLIKNRAEEIFKKISDLCVSPEESIAGEKDPEGAEDIVRSFSLSLSPIVGQMVKSEHVYVSDGGVNTALDNLAKLNFKDEKGQPKSVIGVKKDTLEMYNKEGDPVYFFTFDNDGYKSIATIIDQQDMSYYSQIAPDPEKHVFGKSGGSGGYGQSSHEKVISKFIKNVNLEKTAEMWSGADGTGLKSAIRSRLAFNILKNIDKIFDSSKAVKLARKVKKISNQNSTAVTELVGSVAEYEDFYAPSTNKKYKEYTDDVSENYNIDPRYEEFLVTEAEVNGGSDRKIAGLRGYKDTSDMSKAFNIEDEDVMSTAIGTIISTKLSKLESIANAIGSKFSQAFRDSGLTDPESIQKQIKSQKHWFDEKGEAKKGAAKQVQKAAPALTQSKQLEKETKEEISKIDNDIKNIESQVKNLVNAFNSKYGLSGFPKESDISNTTLGWTTEEVEEFEKDYEETVGIIEKMGEKRSNMLKELDDLKKGSVKSGDKIPLLNPYAGAEDKDHKIRDVVVTKTDLLQGVNDKVKDWIEPKIDGILKKHNMQDLPDLEKDFERQTPDFQEDFKNELSDYLSYKDGKLTITTSKTVEPETSKIVDQVDVDYYDVNPELDHYIGSAINQKMVWYDKAFDMIYEDAVTVLTNKSISKEGSGRQEFSYSWLVKAMSGIEKISSYYNVMLKMCSSVGPVDLDNIVSSDQEDIEDIYRQHPEVDVLGPGGKKTGKQLFRSYKNINESYDNNKNEVYITEQENQVLKNLERSDEDKTKEMVSKIFRAKEQDIMDYIQNYQEQKPYDEGNDVSSYDKDLEKRKRAKIRGFKAQK